MHLAVSMKLERGGAHLPLSSVKQSGSFEVTIISGNHRILARIEHK